MKDGQDIRLTKVSISTLSIVKVIVVLAVFTFFWGILDILAILFISFVIATGINPWIDWLEARRIPRVLGVVTLYLILLGIISLIVFLLVPIIADQLKNITANFPALYDRVVALFSSVSDFSREYGFSGNVQEALGTLNEGLGKLTGGLFNGLVTVFGGLITFLGILVITFYLSLERQALKKFIQSITPAHYQPYLIQVSNRIQLRLGGWLRGQLLLSLLVGAITFIGLLLLGMGEYALVLALIAGVTEFVPIVGPIIGAIPAVFLALAISPVKAILVLALYIVVQQLENQILVPKVMERSVGMNPLVVIIVMLIGAKLAGVWGLLLAVPVSTVLGIILKDFFERRREVEENIEFGSGH